MSLMRSRTVSVSVSVDPTDAYHYVVDPRNLPQWARGLARAVRESSAGWTVDTGEGPVPIRFEPHNSLGVADHWVTVETGDEVYNAVRIVANGDGAEVVFTFFQTPDLDDAGFETAARLVAADLQMLKTILEHPAAFERPAT